MSDPLHLSLILPVVQGEDYIAENVRIVVDALEALERPFEVIVVCDGSADQTPARAAAAGDARVRVIAYPQNRGKGYAICAGVADSRGRFVGWLDSDLDISPRAVVAAVRVLETGRADAAVGSKRHPGSRVEYPAIRRVLSFGYQQLVRLLFRVEIRDTQVGAKVFRREVLETVAPLLLVKRYAFDLEVLAVAAEFGFDRIDEIPIELEYRFTGTGINNAAVRNMFVDTVAIAYRIHLRHWYVRQYAALQRARMDATANGMRPPVPGHGTMSEVIGALPERR